jgi:hypothetical protein
MKKSIFRAGFAGFICCLFSLPLFGQIDSILLQAQPDTLFAPEANGYIIEAVANDGCIDVLNGGNPIDCNPITITSVDISFAEGLGTVLWDDSFVTFEPNAAFLSLDTVIFLPYSIISADMQVSSSHIIIAKAPGFPVPQAWCCLHTSCPGDLVCFSEFSLPVDCNAPLSAASYLQINQTQLSPCWRSIGGTTVNGNYGQIPSEGECGVVGMWASSTYSEGMQSSISVTAGQRYVMSYDYKRGGTGAALDHFYTGFTNGSPTQVPSGPPSFLIHDQQNSVTTARKRVISCFTPDANYNNFLLYPQQNAGSFGQPNISLFNVHMQAMPPSIQTIPLFCGSPATLSVPASCIPGASWSWFNGDNSPIASNTNSITVFPTEQNQQYYASLSFSGTDVSVVGCDDVTANFIILIEGDCCCDDFQNTFANTSISYVTGSSIQFCAPAAVTSADWLSWDFGDGTTAGPVSGLVPCVFHSYASPGTYLATLLIERPLPDGDTCRIQLCELIEEDVDCDDCAQHLQQIANDLDLAVDMSFWTASIGSTTFYPVPGFSPYNVRVKWDFDCDGIVDQTTTGNSPAEGFYDCGPQQVCYTIECLLTQQVACDSMELMKEFDIPCPMSTEFCCEDFMTDIMENGIIGTGIAGNTYQYCVSSNYPSANVEWDLDCNGSLDGGSGLCENFTLAPGNNEICATVVYVSPDGDTCRAKVNACLPVIESPTDTCTCDDPFFTDAVNDGFTWVENPAFTITFTPVSLITDCDEIFWTWDDGSPQISSNGNAPITHVYTNVGVYTVCMLVIRTEPNGTICEREFCMMIDVSGMVAVQDPIPAPEMDVSPNPTSGIVNISLPKFHQLSGYTLSISNIQGQQLQQLQIESADIQLDLHGYAQGLYLLSVYNPQGMLVMTPYKLVKF